MYVQCTCTFALLINIFVVVDHNSHLARRRCDRPTRCTQHSNFTMICELVPKGEARLLCEARDKFVAEWGREPAAAAAAPGRVNLIGEHVDYCEGLVLPVALPFLTVVVGGANGSAECRVTSVLGAGEELRAAFPAPAAAPLRPGSPPWANYVKGVVANFPGEVGGFDAVVVSDVPLGAGLSSSAALEVALFTLLEQLAERAVDGVEKAKLCQKAEHEFPGMPCGIMDQYVVALARSGHALLIDCRSLEARQVEVSLGGLALLVVDSRVRHRLTGSEYPQRRQHCLAAARALALPSLRDATPHHLLQLKAMQCEEEMCRRARHVVEEIARTEEAAACLRRGDLARVGELLYESHESLRTLMEVSCAEVDALVEALRGARGVRGARMTGGGFGGCVVALVEKSEVESIKRAVLARAQAEPAFFTCEPCDGARALRLPPPAPAAVAVARH